MQAPSLLTKCVSGSGKRQVSQLTSQAFDVAIIGTGSIGISTAYYLAKNHGITNIALIDRGQPMEFTSAQSGENYRNWWPHPDMVSFTNHSIDLLEEIAKDSDNRINMNRRGYALATRSRDIDELVDQLHNGLGDSAGELLRYHTDASASSYQRPVKSDWEGVPDGVDILQNQELIQATFPSYANDIETVLHIRRGGDISGQQLGMYMLEKLQNAGAKRVIGSVEAIEQSSGYEIELSAGGIQGTQRIHADKIVNAAGPFAQEIASLLNVRLPVHCTFQQKIAFEDRDKAIPREMPFSIDLDGQEIDWSEEEKEMILEEPSLQWLAGAMPGSIHCRPDGGDRGNWLKLGWAFNDEPTTASWEPQLMDNFPEIVLRGAARLNPTLNTYYEKLPRSMHHYGGYYTMTEENWPLIGPMGPEGAYMNCALSGYGTMAATGAGKLAAAWVAGGELPRYATKFSLDRYDDKTFMTELLSGSRGIL